MYKKPEIVKFGTLRDLTQLGWDNDCDLSTAFGITSGDNLTTFGCPRTS